MDSHHPHGHEAGSSGYLRTNLALFVGGFAAFAMLYGTQPLLPLLAADFGLDAATASLSVSAGTAALALLLIPASILADRFGRARVMQFALAAAPLFAIASAFATDFVQLLILRALLGAAIAGLPAAAMAFLGDEIAPTAQGRAMGLYIAGNAVGGMSGRFLSALVTEWTSWRYGLASIGVLGALAALVFWRVLPPARNFRPRAVALATLLADARRIATDPGLPWLFLTSFLLMGAFVGLYNYLGFHLMAAPYGLSPSAIGAVFLLYLAGSFSSAWTGRLTDRFGRRNVLWAMIVCIGAGLAITLATPLAVVVLGVAVCTFGIFGTHTAASGWVGRRAGERRALAAALYLCAYYLGGSILGTAAGLAWGSHGWPGVIAALGLFLLLLLGVALRLRRVPPIAPATAAGVQPARAAGRP